MFDRLQLLVVIVYLWSIVGLAQRTDVDPSYRGQKVYVNRFFGLSLTPPNGMEVVEALDDGPPKNNTFILIRVLGTGEDERITPVLILSADRLSLYPSHQQNAAAYLSRVVRLQRGSGYSVLEERQDAVLGGYKFLRADFQKGSLREAALVTTRRGFALVLIAIAANERELRSMLDATQLVFNE